ncbi:MAG TPA: enoyl-CoA hydratase-related protein [Dehalococcoidales bacterium]|nr:enoyl-CoA hydratase-related protein [Dehalococcoidales bacterium]
MSYKFSLYTIENGIATITLNRPQILNALSPDSLNELREIVLAAGRDSAVKVVIITGAGKAFAAGADLQSLGPQKLENGRVGAVIDKAANGVIEAIQQIPQAVIAAVNGHCYTGALEIVLSCDIILSSTDARFGDTHVRFGLRPTWGMSQRLPRTIGYHKAKELSFTAGIIDASEALRIGLVSRTVSAGELLDSAKTIARQIMANSLEAVAAYKQLYNNTLGMSLADGLQYESQSEYSISDTQSRIDAFRKK